MANVKISELTATDAATIGADKSLVEVGVSYSGSSFRLNLAELTRASVQSPGTGAITAYDLELGGASYGGYRFGNASIACSSYISGSMNLDGAILVRNIGGPATSQIEFAFADSTNSLRFAIPKGGVGNATYNPRSMLIAGPSPADSAAVTVGYWQGQGIFDNLTCDTGTSGADLGVQNDLEVEGKIYVDDIQESTAAAGLTMHGPKLNVRNGTSTASIDVYRTYTDESNWEHMYLRASSGDFRIGTTQSGGTTRPLKFYIGNVYSLALQNYGRVDIPVKLYLTDKLEFGSNGPILEQVDTNYLALRDGTQEQRLYAYNTYTSDSVYERMYIGWNSNTCRWEFNQVGAADRTMYITNANTHVFSATTATVTCGIGNSSNCLYVNSGLNHCNLRSKGSSYIFIDSDNNSTTDEFAVMTNSFTTGASTYVFQANEVESAFHSPLKMVDGNDLVFETTTGSKIGTATGQKIGFWDATPVAQQVLATGSTTDDVITLLQTLGLCRQS